MKLLKIKNLAIFSIFTLLLCTSCDSNDDSNPLDTEPILLENYYFKGTLDGIELNIERKVYESPSDNASNAISIDFGGSSTNDIESLGTPGTGFCYGRYACGLFFSDTQENPDEIDSAKMYFSRIPIGECTLENELTNMNTFLASNEYEYDNFLTSSFSQIVNSVALDFFPVELEGQVDYYSSRFGDNTDATFQITSVSEEDGVFIVEGNFNCKLYRFTDDTDMDFKVLENGTFKIKISANLDA